MIDKQENILAALAVVDSESYETEKPSYVDPSEIMVHEGWLTEEDVEALRSAPITSTRYKTYMAYRRQMVIRLVNAGYTHSEVASMLNISVHTVGEDFRRVRKLYDKLTVKDWALMVEDRVMQLDHDIYHWRRRRLSPTMTLNDALRIDEHVYRLEDKKDKLLGLEKAAAAQHETTTKLKVELSFEQPALVTPVRIDEAVTIDE